ncbi:MAG: hypothetical protein AAGI34_06930 [Pseudomonadota bacterium]
MYEEPDDPIAPLRIEHKVEGVDPADFTGDPWNAQTYNFLDYHFARDSHTCLARTYLDEIEQVTLFQMQDSEGGAGFRRDVLAYLHRRFARVLVPDETGDRFVPNIPDTPRA